MGFITKEDGTIIARQGDSGEIYIEGLDTDKNYKIFFGVYDKNRKPVGKEVSIYSYNVSEVVLKVPANVSDMWTVQKNEPYAELFYGIKVCDEETHSENTLVLSGCEYDTENSLVVYPRKVEGLLNGQG